MSRYVHTSGLEGSFDGERQIIPLTKRLDWLDVTNEDLPRVTCWPAVAEVIDDRAGHLGLQRKFELSLCLRLCENNPVFTPTDVLESKTADIGRP